MAYAIYTIWITDDELLLQILMFLQNHLSDSFWLTPESMETLDLRVTEATPRSDLGLVRLELMKSNLILLIIITDPKNHVKL